MSSCTDAMSEAINSSFQYPQSQKIQTEAEIPEGNIKDLESTFSTNEKWFTSSFCGLYVRL